MPTPDPFTQVYAALWGLLENHAGFAALVKVGNRVTYTVASDRSPDKPQVMAGDLPEVRIVPVGGPIEVAPTSTVGCTVVQGFVIEVATGDQRLQVAMFPVKWQLLRALGSARDNLGLAFVKKFRLTDAREALDAPAPGSAAPGSRGGRFLPPARGIKGWSAVVRINVELWFNSEDLAG